MMSSQCPCCGKIIGFGESAEMPIYIPSALDNWISVETALPEEGEPVIVTDGNECRPAYYLMSSTYRWEDWDTGTVRQSFFDTITHWQPLPAPPQGGE
jgi:hypothetical protein